MASDTSRRAFIAQTAKAGLGIYVGSGILSSCTSVNQIIPAAYTTGFMQEPLPYGYSALEKAIDAKTMELHYTKHAAGYATNLQGAVKAEAVAASTSLESLLQRISKYSVAMRNNGGGHYNHELFWKTMTPAGEEKPSGALGLAIDKSFGSFEAFKTAFSDAGKSRFGSGWAWLLVDGNKSLRVSSTPNQDNPLMDVAEVRGFPLLGLDVWEHAYYLRYQNKRPEYIAAWWKVVNWKYVGERFQSVV